MKQPKLSFGPWIFSPSFISTLATLLLLPLFVYLGFWQLNRAHEKQSLQNNFESRINEPLLFLEHLPAGDISKFRYRQLQVTGVFLNEQVLLLDNQILKGQVGYHVITPLLPTGSNQILLVDRGWIPIGKSRAEIPTFSSLQGEFSLTGTINLPISGLQLTKEDPLTQTSWPLRVQRLNFQALSKHFTYKLYPFILQLNPKDPHGFIIEPLTLNMPANRHRGYAIQWFAMALAVFIYYVVINCRSVKCPI